MGQNILAETLDVLGEGLLADSEDDEADVAENELIGFVFVFLSLTDEASLFLEGEFGIFPSDRRICFPHLKHGKRIL